MRKNKFLTMTFKILFIPLLLMFGGLGLSCYGFFSKEKMRSELIDQALKGNRIASAILQEYPQTEKLDKRIVKEALKSNPYAIAILNVYVQESPSKLSWEETYDLLEGEEASKKPRYRLID